MNFTKMRSTFFTIILNPRSSDANDRRHEYILNVLLATLLSSMLLINSVIVINYAQGLLTKDNPLATTIIFNVVVAGLLVLSRCGYYRVVTYLFISIVLATGLQLLFTFGFMLPAVALVFALVIVMAGVLIGARASLISGIVLSLLLIFVANAQLHGRLHPNTSWLTMPFSTGDAFGYAVVFLIIGTVSWLSNREIDHSLQRALASEVALAQERDNLEIKVQLRTKQLEQSQLVRVMELQKFAEIGRISTHLIHEVANPLTAASLHLEQMTDSPQPALLRQARISLSQLEKYVQTARNQIRHESNPSNFLVGRELRLLHQLFADRAARLKVSIDLNTPSKLRFYGDAVKFRQLMSNLISNALDAYERQPQTGNYRQISVMCSQQKSNLICTVSDTAGGISKTNLPRIFDPLFTTKAGTGHNMGIGLALVKQYVEQDFKGQITVAMNQPASTIFTVLLRPEKPRR